jgi:DNA-binding HxlR family transcriptional regulator
MAEPLDPEMFDPVCPSSAMPIQIGDKWTAMVVLCLEGGRRRFSELKGPLRGITPKVLTQTLRAMERDGLVTRTAYDENPPRVEYELTPLGRSLEQRPSPRAASSPPGTRPETGLVPTAIGQTRVAGVQPRRRSPIRLRRGAVILNGNEST